MITQRAGDSMVRQLQGFAKHLSADYDAVRAAVELAWSNGQVEGQINRLKTIKPNFRTLTASTAAKPQNSAVLLDSDRIVVLKITALLTGFSLLTGSATVCWHSG